jgi:HlyD family secretion protein
VISVDNSDLKLLPYLTANVKFEVDERKDVLLVPNAALRYKPGPELIEGGDSKTGDPKDSEASADGAPGHRSGRHDKHGTENAEKGRLWQVGESGKLKPLEVQVGLSDGVVTEITGGEVQEGDDVVTGEARPGAVSATGDVNPFGPPRFGGRRPR